MGRNNSTSSPPGIQCVAPPSQKVSKPEQNNGGGIMLVLPCSVWLLNQLCNLSCTWCTNNTAPALSPHFLCDAARRRVSTDSHCFRNAWHSVVAGCMAPSAAPRSGRMAFNCRDASFHSVAAHPLRSRILLISLTFAPPWASSEHWLVSKAPARCWSSMACFLAAIETAPGGASDRSRIPWPTSQR